MKYELGYHSSDIEHPHVAFVLDNGAREELFDVSLYSMDVGNEQDGAYVESREALDLMVSRANASIGTDAAVKAIRDESAKREEAFLRDMLDGIDFDHVGLGLDELRTAYHAEENYDAIWFDGGMADDNARHEADDYHEGFQNGLTFAVQALIDAGVEVPPISSE